MTTAEILDSARKLRADEQLFLIDSLHDMLDEPDPAIQAAWIAEAKDRLVAYDKGALPLADLAPVLAKYR
jgi:energy-converting hydrogenase Eha subunit F